LTRRWDDLGERRWVHQLQDFAVQVVRHELEKTGVKLMSWQGSPLGDCQQAFPVCGH
jgi:hypothetical protein